MRRVRVSLFEVPDMETERRAGYPTTRGSLAGQKHILENQLRPLILFFEHGRERVYYESRGRQSEQSQEKHIRENGWRPYVHSIGTNAQVIVACRLQGLGYER